MNSVSRETFSSQRGFILACIGAAVSMGNIWLFPVRMSHFGATFLIPYLICMILVGSTGMIGNIALGRLSKGGPITAYSQALKERFGNERAGWYLGLFPSISVVLLASGYFVVQSWVLRYLFSSLTGNLIRNNTVIEFTKFFNEPTLNTEYVWLFFAIAITMFILFFGVKDGIEKINTICVPLFFMIFIALAIYIAFLPNAVLGYRFLLKFDLSLLANPMIWIYALGQAFSSLAITGASLVVYGSFLKRSVDIPKSVSIIMTFDLLASLLAAIVIIPAMAVGGSTLDTGGSGLMFIYIPYIFRTFPSGRVLLVLFFLATFLVGLTTLVNLVEVPILSLIRSLKYSRELATWLICTYVLIVGLLIHNYVLPWINFCTIYLIPISAGMTGIVFYWIVNKNKSLSAINQSARFRFNDFNYYMGRYVYCGIDVLILVLGIVFGNIGG